MFPLRKGLFTQSFLYLVSGGNHFWHRQFYVRIMPDHYSHPEALVAISGVAEILGGLGLLLPLTRRFSAVGLAAMLTVFLDVHVFMIRNAERFPQVPKWLLWSRLPLQVLLIAWALLYARRQNDPIRSLALSKVPIPRKNG